MRTNISIILSAIILSIVGASAQQIAPVVISLPTTKSLTLDWWPATATATNAAADSYILFWGGQPGKYTNLVYVTNCIVTLPGFNVGATYYFAVRSCDEKRSRNSVPSNEIKWVVPLYRFVATVNVFKQTKTWPGTAYLGAHDYDLPSGTSSNALIFTSVQVKEKP